MDQDHENGIVKSDDDANKNEIVKIDDDAFKKEMRCPVCHHRNGYIIVSPLNLMTCLACSSEIAYASVQHVEVISKVMKYGDKLEKRAQKRNQKRKEKKERDNHNKQN